MVRIHTALMRKSIQNSHLKEHIILQDGEAMDASSIYWTKEELSEMGITEDRKIMLIIQSQTTLSF